MGCFRNPKRWAGEMIFPGQQLPTATKAQRERRDAEFKTWAAGEAERIRRQRAYLTALSGPLRDAMVKRMLDRAWALLDAGECEAADALLEFVPEACADKLLGEFFDE